MIANITPLIRLPASTDVFDYFIPEELTDHIKPGQLVQIPFRTDKVPGVVLSLAATQASTKFRARPIDSVLETNPILTPDQLALTKVFSTYYFVTPGSVARLMAPERPERTVRAKPTQFADTRFAVSSEKIPLLKSTAEKIPSVRFAETQDVSSFVWTLLYLIKHSKQSQLLVLFPTIEMISAIAGSVHKMCSDKLAIIHSGLGKSAYWHEYQKIISGSARVILSTRQGVFLPIQRNSQIIFFDSTSDDFKQYEQHPRYDARIVGVWLAHATKSKLIFISSSHILEAKKHDSLSIPAARNRSLTISLVDMQNEMNQKDFSIIAERTLAAINQAGEKKKKSVIIALREESEKGVSVKSLLEILTPKLKNCNVSASTENFDVLVTTPRALEGLKLSSERQNLGLLIFASIEPMLAIPDYRSAERSYYRLKHWQMLAQELGFLRIILQSYSPESLAMRAFAYGEFELFNNQELANRKELGYPPFSKLIKLSYRGKIASTAENLKKELAPRVTISGPFTDSNGNASLLLKVFNTINLPEISKLGTDWIVDRDPENVL